LLPLWQKRTKAFHGKSAAAKGGSPGRRIFLLMKQLVKQSLKQSAIVSKSLFKLPDSYLFNMKPLIFAALILLAACMIMPHASAADLEYYGIDTTIEKNLQAREHHRP